MLNDLTILNDPDAPYTFREGNKVGTPDFTLGGGQILDILNSWQVLDTTNSDSDHLHIYFTLNLKVTKNNNFRFKTLNSNFKKFNRIFKDYVTNLQFGIDNVLNQDDLDSYKNDFQNIIQTIKEVCYRKRKLCFTPKLSWYTRDLKEKRNRLNAIYKRSVKHPDNLQYRIVYKRERAAYKKEKIQKKKNCLKYCENSSEIYGRIFKIARCENLKNTDLVHTLLEKSEHFETYDDVLTLLIAEHFGTNISRTYNRFEKVVDIGLDEICISSRELKFAADTIKNNKAPGFDNVDGRTVKNLVKNFKNIIIAILNKCFTLSHFPTIWKKAMIFFFRKQNKDPLNPRSYRPISLLPTLGKLFEK